MIGTVFAVAIVFAILLVATRSLGYYRGRFSVAGADSSSDADIRRSAAVGAGSGLVVLALVALLYVGVTRWDWFGQPAPKQPAVLTPAKPSPAPGLGAGAKPSPVPGMAASPSPTH